MSRLADIRDVLKSTVQMSSTSRSRPQADTSFPRIPGSLNHDHDHELKERYAPTPYSQDSVLVPHTAASVTPYLGLRARLSQVWLNKWTILLLLILVRVLLAVQGLDHGIANAKTQALSACTSVENVGSAMASMPHYMSGGVNALAAKGMEKAHDALMSLLMLSVTAVGEIVLFVINLLTATYVCLITLVVGGAMSAALDVIDKAGEFLNKTLSSVTGDIAEGVDGFEDRFNGFLDTIGDISGFFGGSKEPPRIDLSSQIDKINNIKFDSDALSADLKQLQDKIPTFDEVHNFTNTLIRVPFEEVKKLINESTSGYSFDKSVFPVAEKQALAFCSDNNGINAFFDGLAVTASAAKKIFIGILIAAAVLVCIPMAWREIKRWRAQQDRAAVIKNRSFDPMDVIYLVSRPYTSTAGVKVAARFRGLRKQVLIRWFVAYITSLPALFILLLGIAGLISCLFQYILLKQIEQETPALAAQVGEFTGNVVVALNNASESWAVGANTVILATNDEINSDVFGWVNTTTTAVNETLNAFVDGVQGTLNDTFGGTVLYNPIQETLRCLIFLKVEGIQKALTWVHDNAHVSFPDFDKDVFSLGAAAELDFSGDSQSFLSSPGSEATDDITGAVLKLINFMKEAILQEVYIALALVGVYLFIVLLGLGRVIIGMVGRDKTRAEGGPTYANATSADLYPSVYPANTGGASEGGIRSRYSPRQNQFHEFGADEVETPWARTRADDGFGPAQIGGFANVGGHSCREKGGVAHGHVREGSVPRGNIERVRTTERTQNIRQSSYGVVGEKVDLPLGR